ncbi:serine hydrolase domain-containing protein [uncultured Desulfosarcina sp.]|uniref:serine hydrolase domain-containing protein n=1 Tax=uncultured Desulfosarcina sp. TaxID=218289 RepID=UPI0029C97DD6|nr:serine hydrolase domain-containing protein [uncultured Desulfosarcina sp.]
MKSDPIHDLMQQGLRENVFPGAVLLVGKGDAVLFFEAYGKANLFSNQPMTRETVFDLASLTKPLATTLAVARLADQGRIHLYQPVGTWLPALAGSDKAAITIRQLLCHQGGFPAHRLLYMTLKSLLPRERKAAVLNLLKHTPLEYQPGERTLYSDLGFMLLCRLVEAVGGCPMNRFLKEGVYEPMGLDDLFFVDLTGSRRPRRPYAATELCPVRNRLLVGEVHDDNAWFAGGIDGHAGLFGTAEAVFQLLRLLVADWRGRSSAPIFSEPILCDIFHGAGKNPLPLGFDRPSVENSSAGRYFSANTIGHLGFTGVSFWMDLDKEICIVLLTNRVHPFRWNTRLGQFRPHIHDRIMEHFEIYLD